MASHPYRVTERRYGASATIIALALAAALGGCAGKLGDITGSVPTRPDAPGRHNVDALGVQYRADPKNPEIAIAYARALRAGGQRAQAVAVLQQTSLMNPKSQAILAEYGRALADAGRQQALEVFSKAHTPDQPDWRLLNAQGAVLDQMGNFAEARSYYETALKIAPDESAILSNLGLSYMLAKDLPRAEATLKRATARADADPRVRQNLALVLGLQGKFEEAERVASGDLPPDEARANVAYLREMLKQPNPIKSIAAPKKPKRG
jgi:Flp pilus assembly protein TadD